MYTVPCISWIERLGFWFFLFIFSRIICSSHGQQVTIMQKMRTALQSMKTETHLHLLGHTKEEKFSLYVKLVFIWLHISYLFFFSFHILIFAVSPFGGWVATVTILTSTDTAFDKNVPVVIVKQHWPHKHVHFVGPWLVTRPPQLVPDIIKSPVVSHQPHGRVLDHHLPCDVAAFRKIPADIFVGGQGLQSTSCVLVLMPAGHLKENGAERN